MVRAWSRPRREAPLMGFYLGCCMALAARVLASWQGTAWPFAAVFRHAIGRGWGWCAPGPACRALHPYAVLCVALVLRGVCFIVIML